jgi:tetratricopeptide (TPR) repeat protein
MPDWKLSVALVLCLTLVGWRAEAFEESELRKMCPSRSPVGLERAGYCLLLAEMAQDDATKVMAYRERGIALAIEGFFKLAVHNLTKGLMIQPDDLVSLQYRAFSNVKSNQFTDAWVDVQVYREKDDLEDLGVYAAAAVARNNDGVEAGLAELDRQFSKFEAPFRFFYQESLTLHATMLIEAGRQDAGFRILDELVDRDKYNTFRPLRAAAHRKAGNYREAIDDFEVLRKDSRVEHAERALAQLYSEAPTGIRDLGKAHEAAMNALDKNGADMSDIVRLARIQSLRGQHDEATRTYWSILVLYPDFFDHVRDRLVSFGFAEADLKRTDNVGIADALMACSNASCLLFDLVEE